MVPVPDAVTPPAGWRLRLEELSIRHGRTKIIDGFTWTHTPGRVAWVVGENGAGKSSLLRVLARRATPTGGTVAWCGPPALTPDLLYYQPAMRLPARAFESEWSDLLDALRGPEDAAPVPPRLTPPRRSHPARFDRLSTGEAKRILLVGLLRRTAPFIFLDEPYEHLSEDAKAALTTALVERARSAVVVVATNQSVPAGAGAGPIVCLSGPRVRVVDPTEVNA